MLAEKDRNTSGQAERLADVTSTGLPDVLITMLIGPILEGEYNLIILEEPGNIVDNFTANRPQPDNREGNESCLAVLNNFYNDGVRFHDVLCHHRKPIICEA